MIRLKTRSVNAEGVIRDWKRMTAECNTGKEVKKKQGGSSTK